MFKVLIIKENAVPYSYFPYHLLFHIRIFGSKECKKQILSHDSRKQSMATRSTHPLASKIILLQLASSVFSMPWRLKALYPLEYWGVE
jgi:hypothetical protein